MSWRDHGASLMEHNLLFFVKTHSSLIMIKIEDKPFEVPDKSFDFSFVFINRFI